MYIYIADQVKGNVFVSSQTSTVSEVHSDAVN